MNHQDRASRGPRTHHAGVQGLFSQFGYLAVFLALTAAGLGVPIPEELTQLTAGALAHEGILRLELAVPVIWVGILTGDSILFLIARRHGPWLLSTRLVRRVLKPARREWLERHYARHAFWTVAAARHAGGIRVAAFTLAGVTGVRYRTFLVADGLSGLVSVPIVTYVGYVLWHQLSEARRDVHVVQLALLGVAVVAVAIVLVVRRRARRVGQSAGA